MSEFLSITLKACFARIKGRENEERASDTVSLVQESLEEQLDPFSACTVDEVGKPSQSCSSKESCTSQANLKECIFYVIQYA